MKLPNVVTCSFCKDLVKRKNLARHFADGCLKLRKLAEYERVCTRCQEIKAEAEFPKNSLTTGKHWCLNCGTENARAHRAGIKSGELQPTVSPHIRPGRWVLKPCKYCGELLNYKQRQFHKQRCTKRPETARVLIKDTSDATIIPDMGNTRAEHIANHKRRVKSNNLRLHYGITIEEYERLLTLQDGKCAICQATQSGQNRGANWLHVDHDHATGKIRGLLCTACNHLVGNCRENPALLLKAIDYLLAHRPIAIVS